MGVETGPDEFIHERILLNTIPKPHLGGVEFPDVLVRPLGLEKREEETLGEGNGDNHQALVIIVSQGLKPFGHPRGIGIGDLSSEDDILHPGEHLFSEILGEIDKELTFGVDSHQFSFLIEVPSKRVWSE